MDQFLQSSSIATAELVARNGDAAGERKPLKVPVTIVGSGGGCDVRLKPKFVRPVHCFIAVAPEGLHIRAWGGNDTLVNGKPVVAQWLRDGDLIRVGPYEFEIRWKVPAAQIVDDSPLASVGPTKAAAKVERLEELHRQVAEARARHRRDKAEHEAAVASQLSELAEVRDELERREAAVSTEHVRLRQLRSRFIKRWKKHWGSRRQDLQSQIDQLAADGERLDTARIAIEQESEQLRRRTETEESQLESAWAQLRATEKQARTERARRHAELDQRQQAIVDAETRLAAERAEIDEERMRIEHRSADLRIEADGLESRVVNLRAVLLQLESQRAIPPLPSPTLETLSPPAGGERPIEADAESEQRRAELERIAGDLSDQQQTLAEQIDRLALAREQWREHECRIVDEMAELGEQLRLREDRLVDREKGVAFEEEQLERERANLEQARNRLDGWQTGLQARETAWTADSSRTELQLRRREAQAERREQALSELFRRWSERRRREVEQLRAEHRRCESLRATWSEQKADWQRREEQLQTNLRDLAARALVLEQARQQLLQTAENPALAEKRLERLSRSLQATISRAEKRDEERGQALLAERGQLKELFSRTLQQVEEAAVKERGSAAASAELERREFEVTRKEFELLEAESAWKSETAILAQERISLREEIDRLAGLLIEGRRGDSVPLARAA